MIWLNSMLYVVVLWRYVMTWGSIISEVLIYHCMRRVISDSLPWYAGICVHITLYKQEYWSNFLHFVSASCVFSANCLKNIDMDLTNDISCQTTLRHDIMTYDISWQSKAGVLTAYWVTLLLRLPRCISLWNAALISPWQKANLDVTQSHPLRRTHLGQYQAPSPVLRWPGDGDWYLMHKWLGMCSGRLDKLV